MNSSSEPSTPIADRLPVPPSGDTGELSDEELAGVVGGLVAWPAAETPLNADARDGA